MGRATAIFFCPVPWVPWEGSKGQILFTFNYKVNFKDLLYQTQSLFSQMKETKYIRRDFNSDALVMPKGSDFGAQGY